DATPAAALLRRFALGEQQARGLLVGAGIDIAMQARPMAALSGGQRARLAMLILRLQKPTLYLLDEPTNHLDIEGQEALAGELAARSAACII
ncbi:ABC-F family ATP-binding cassette domain-containing protein, partial [Mycobacterium tuberculosis]|nr:ABC-F family ATP-binding cassette domain-containing protein [Mycobacterium tuberculosis]